ncbi:hypothetical protein HVW69_05035 [Citrobacter freundii]|nr:hypothetical protein HVW69_05035 [Citrobacter freundii]
MSEYIFSKYHCLASLFTIMALLTSPAVFSQEQKQSFSWDDNENCTAEHVIFTCSLDNTVSISQGTPGVVERKVEVFKLAPNNGKNMLRDNINTEKLKTEINDQMLKSGGQY